MSKTPEWKMRAVIKSMIHRCINKNKNESCLKYVDYTPVDLKHHLEKQFKPDMNWENYGALWEVDHIRPIASFIFFDEQGNVLKDVVSNVNSLDNLRPLYKLENISKGSEYNGCVYSKGKIVKYNI